MTAVYLERRDIPSNMARSYAVDVQPTLFGEWAVIRQWGRIGTNGQSRQDWFPSRPQAEAAQARQVERKRRRGYHILLDSDQKTPPVIR